MRSSRYKYRSPSAECSFLENGCCLLCGKAVDHYAVTWLFYNIRSRNERHQDSDALHVLFKEPEIDRGIFIVRHIIFCVALFVTGRFKSIGNFSGFSN
jgi:hypothetical protein